MIQWTVILFLLFLAVRSILQKDFKPDFEAYCPFGGIQSLSSYLLNNSLACTMTTTQIAMGIMLIIGIILFSKLFCAYICPLGTISEWLGNVGAKYKVNIKISALSDNILRALKYILLFITFYFTLGSSELFCKKYDPFYAVVTGFSMDVVWWYATIAIAMVLIGSLFIRLFWCKYICPLGAISNIIKFTWFFFAVMLSYILILKIGIQLSFIWPMAIACIGGYLLELMGEKFNFFPVAKITRNEFTCTSCQLCSRKCPQVIDVANMKVVRDVDCNLCGECLEVCPEKDTLQINQKSGLKWLPMVAVVVLFILGLLLSSNWELPTIDQKWGTAGEIEKASIFTKSGISEIKCYGSSMAFADKMKQVKGVFGVATYVSSHTVKIYYDATILNDQMLQQELFTPRKAIIQSPGSEFNEVKMFSLMLDNFFDPSDFDNLSVLLKEKTDAYGLESEFSCPVTVRIYFPGISEWNGSKLVEILETKKIEISSGKDRSELNLSFKVVGQPILKTITGMSYYFKMFEPYHLTFNWKPNYRETDVDTIVVPLHRLRYDQDSLSYLVSHLSNDSGVVGFHTTMDSLGHIKFKINYLDSLTTSANILKAMTSDTLLVNYDGGETGKIANWFKY
jgi:ferredoxin